MSRPVVDGKRFPNSPAGRRASTGAAEDVSDLMHSDANFSTDRGKCVNDGVGYRAAHTKDGIRYASGSAHNPFQGTGLKQPGGPKSNKRASI